MAIYVVLYNDIEEALHKLPSKLNSDEIELKKFEAKLKELKDRYAIYYLTQYEKYRLSKEQFQRKEELINSDKKRICDTLSDATYLSNSNYQQWTEQITKLKKQSKDLSKKELERNLYHDFNPKEFAGKPIFSVGELEDKVDAIYEEFIENGRNVFDDSF